MIRHEFISGGFPLSKRTPILTITKDIAYTVFNRYELYEIAQKEEILYCYGVWPGKRNTDCFEIDYKEYIKVLPPKENADIDNAEEVLIIINKGEPDTVKYKNDDVEIVSHDKRLVDYIKAHLKYRIQIE